ncbi:MULTISPECIES: hypothetical protein [unclassified Streptomyces]|uniref:hypothetical protein n=1 Tax=unclassified Streptomyces TaxID=2593676 RepID=UPI000C4F9D7D|nr:MULTISPECIES: hypothetical protein [unclassified Streptomyces]
MGLSGIRRQTLQAAVVAAVGGALGACGTQRWLSGTTSLRRAHELIRGAVEAELRGDTP